MFRRRLSLVMICLATTIALQGVGAVLALRHAEQKVISGRVASDIHQGFVELSATKQRLRSWATQFLIGAGGNPLERDALHLGMHDSLARLALLAQQAAATDKAATVQEQLARIDAIEVMRAHVQTLEQTLRTLQPLPPDVRARQAWDSLDELFEQARGRDLRQVIAESITRESAAMQREREAADRSLRFMHAFWLGMSLALALMALLATAYFARALRRPIDTLVAGAQALRLGRLDHRIALHGKDEFADVARGMNAMAQELEEHRQRQHRQRLELEALVHARTQALNEANESLQRTDVRRRQLLADISHELRTPTTAIRGEAEITLRGHDRPAADYRDALQRIAQTSRQLGTVIDDLLAMARSDMETLSVVRQPLDLSLPLQQALDQCTPLAAQHQIGLPPQPLPAGQHFVWADPQRLCQLLLLLLDNAVRYSHPQGHIQLEVATHAAQGDAPPEVELRVIDQGIGIPAAELDQVFERHFRGRAARQHRAAGSGLGLSIAQALAQAHGGHLCVHSPWPASAAGGTCVALRLPSILPEQAQHLTQTPLVPAPAHPRPAP